MNKAKRWLTVLWFAGGSGLILILFLQTISGHYRGKEFEVWNGFAPMIAPTLALIMSVWIVDVRHMNVESRTVDRFFFRLTFAVSFTYLFLLLLMLFIEPFSSYTTLELLEKTSIGLSILQGLVIASLGAFFVKKEET